MSKDNTNDDINAQFSYFKPPIYKQNLTPSGTRTINQISREIKDESLCLITAKIRECKTKKERDKLKQAQLPYVTFGGTFKYRNEENLIKRSGLIVLDIDNLGEKVQEIRTAILKEIQPAIMFLSPSGEGLKVVCRIDPQDEHSAYYKALKRFFQQHFSISIDKGGDITRTCFLCHDPDAFISDNPTSFDHGFINSMSTNESNEALNHKTTNESDEIFRRGKIWLEKNISCTSGSRHNYITEFATFLNRSGVDQEFAEVRLLELEQTGFDKKEISGIVKGVYRKTELFGVAPMNINHGRDQYTSFPLKLLWVTRDQFIGRLEEILSERYQKTTGEIPTSIKTSYIVDTINGKFNPELLLLLAAVKSIIGYKNYTRTTRQFVFERMYGGIPWKRFTRYSFQKLMDIAIEKNMMVKIADYRCMYISIRYSVEELEKEILENLKKRNEKKQKSINAAKRISELKKSFSAS